MALILEDGTGKTDSNTYALEATLTAYLLERGFVLTGSKTAENLLISAMDYLETKSYIGSKLTSEQALLWPRDDVYIDGFAIDTDVIPRALIQTQLQLAWEIDQGFNPLSVVGRGVKREKVDSLEVEYLDNAKTTDTIRSVNAMLAKLLISGGSMQIRAGRVV